VRTTVADRPNRRQPRVRSTTRERHQYRAALVDVAGGGDDTASDVAGADRVEGTLPVVLGSAHVATVEGVDLVLPVVAIVDVEPGDLALPGAIVGREPGEREFDAAGMGGRARGDRCSVEELRARRRGGRRRAEELRVPRLERGARLRVAGERGLHVLHRLHD